MEPINKAAFETAGKNMKLLDDCVAMAECLKVLRERGVATLDEYGIELRPDVFEQIFPGLEWKEHTTLSGKFMGVYHKEVEYRGCLFETYKTEED